VDGPGRAAGDVIFNFNVNFNASVDDDHANDVVAVVIMMRKCDGSPLTGLQSGASYIPRRG
jgi:hypothetical protein